MSVIAESVKFRGWICDVILDKYTANGSDAIVLSDHETGERVAVATTCLAGDLLRPFPGCVAIKDYSENEGMLSALSDAGIIEDTGARISMGFVDVPIARILKRDDCGLTQ